MVAKRSMSGRNPSAREIAEAKRIQSLSPEQKKGHPSSVMADLAKLEHINTYESLPEYYLDKPYSCRVCGKVEIWKAVDQKWYYEEAKGHTDAEAVECHNCRAGKEAKEK